MSELNYGTLSWCQRIRELIGVKEKDLSILNRENSFQFFLSTKRLGWWLRHIVSVRRLYFVVRGGVSIYTLST